MYRLNNTATHLHLTVTGYLIKETRYLVEDGAQPKNRTNMIWVSVSASYCIPQCARLIAGVCTHYVVYNISKKKNTVDKSKIKER